MRFKRQKIYEIDVDEFYIEEINLTVKGIYTTNFIKCNFIGHNSCNCNICEENNKKNYCAIKNNYCI